MAEKHILHMLTPLPRISPFDANMALDAGFDAVLPYGAVTLEDIGGLVQDAIFSRPPKAGARTGMFIGGKDAIAALDMLDAARQAMVPPFALSLFADPSGSFTTAAAMVACVRKLLSTEWQRGLDGLKLVIFGATGVVGFASGVIAALEGANVVLAGYDGAARVERSAAEITRRFGVTVRAADASTDDRKSALLRDADAALCAGRAGVQILTAGDAGRCAGPACGRRRERGAAGGCGRARRAIERCANRRLENAGHRRAGNRRDQVPHRVRSVPSDD